MSARVLNLARLRPSAVLLDLGCGAGATLVLAKRRDSTIEAIGLDQSPFTDGGGQSANPRLRADGTRLPLRSNGVDAVISECSVCLMRPLDAVFEDIHRVLRPGGRLVISDFYAMGRLSWSNRELAEWACVLDARAPRETLEALDRVGFKEVRVEDHAEALWEIEERIQSRADVIGLVETLAVTGHDPIWRDAAQFLREAREARDIGALRYGIFEATRP